MCTVLMAWRCYRDVPLLLAANRDELLARPSGPPQRLAEHITGGVDLFAGGTWLAVADDARLCAVTNRRSGAGGEVRRDPTRRSRGDIPLLVLQTAEDAVVALLRSLGPGRYNPVNVVHASRNSAVVAAVEDGSQPQLTELTPGTHVLTVRNVDDGQGAKDLHLQRRLNDAATAATTPALLMAAMEELLRSHESPSGDPLDAACIHGDEYGTVSAATVALHADGKVEYRHAPGRPCVTPFSAVAVG